MNIFPAVLVVIIKNACLIHARQACEVDIHHYLPKGEQASKKCHDRLERYLMPGFGQIAIGRVLNQQEVGAQLCGSGCRNTKSVVSSDYLVDLWWSLLGLVLTTNHVSDISCGCEPLMF